MRRRDFFRGLLALPLVPLAKFLPQSNNEWLINWGVKHGPEMTLLDYARNMGPDPALLPVVEALNWQPITATEIIYMREAKMRELEPILKRLSDKCVLPKGI